MQPCKRKQRNVFPSRRAQPPRNAPTDLDRGRGGAACPWQQRAADSGARQTASTLPSSAPAGVYSLGIWRRFFFLRLPSAP